MTSFRYATASLAVLVLVACGGSDGSPPSPPVNNAPAFTSGTAASTPENSVGIIYTASASDADGDALAFSIGGGDDAALFALDSTSGDLSFLSPPDFEAPADADTDNIYNLTLSVTDGQGGRDELTLTVTVTNIDQGFQIVRVGTDFTQPLYVQALPDGTGRVLVLEKGGRIRVLNPDTGVTDSVDFLDVSDDISTLGEGGLLGMTLDPNYQTNGQFYINVTAGRRVDSTFRTEIRRYNLVPGRTDVADKNTLDVILQYLQPVANHNAGWLGFDRNNYLVIPTGDGGDAATAGENRSQNPNLLLGKVLRIDPSADDFPADDLRDYAIPPDNTYSDLADGLPEIFAIGLRNPFRASFDPATGDLLIGDVGQRMIEEIDRLPMDDPTRDFGWNTAEGTQAFNGPPLASYTAPVTEYRHGDGDRQGDSITAGYVYTGPVEALQNEFIFADFISNNIWSVPAADLVDGSTLSSDAYTVLTTAFTPDQGSLSLISSFGLDEDRNLYIVTIGGDIFRLEAEP